MEERQITGWGLYPAVRASVHRARWVDELVALARGGQPMLPLGNRRSYGDACLYPRLVSALPLNHFLAFDPERGLLRVQAGATLDQIIRFALPRGFFLPVTPGTKFPTLGGCVAADVHGKNHHLDGSIAGFVEELEMVLADGSRVHCSRSERADLFWATLGGMGLTGFICSIALRLRKISSAYIRMRCVRTASLAEACRLFARTQAHSTYSVAWIDCLARGGGLGRGLVMLGEHAPAAEAPSPPLRIHGQSRLSVPFPFPGLALNFWSVRAFNALYYHRQWRRESERLIHYDPYFYPLDAVRHWNRIYGRSGFLQYQFVVPFADGEQVMEEIIERIAARGMASFLAVLKTFGPRQQGPLSFPIPGYTLALDIPLRDAHTIPFLRQLNGIIAGAGGRIYLAKDAILEREDFELMYPQLETFKETKRRYDPHNRFRSLQAERLGLV